MKKIRTVIIEDERPAAIRLKNMVATLRPDWEIIILPGVIDIAVEWFAENEHPDLIFLDIHLMDGNSFHFLEMARPESMVIFVTAYDEYALNAFSFNSIDYLLKPVKKDRLTAAIEKFERLSTMGERCVLSLDDLYSALGHVTEKKYRTRFLVTCNNKFVTLMVSDIAYFHTENKITFAVTRQKQSYAIDISLNKLEEELDSNSFFRVNRQFLISAEAIKKIEPYFLNKVRIQVDPPYEGSIQVSREKVAALKEWLDF